MGLIEHIESKQSEHLEELKGLLRIPSVSAKSEHKPDIDRAARWVAEKLRAAGLDLWKWFQPRCTRLYTASPCKPRASPPF